MNIKVNEDSDMKKTHLNSLAMSVDIMLCELGIRFSFTNAICQCSGWNDQRSGGGGLH